MWATAVGTPSTQGKAQANAGPAPSATLIYVTDHNLADADISSYLAAIKSGDIVVINQPGTANTMTFMTIGAATLVPGAVPYYSIPVTGGQGTEPGATLVTLAVTKP